MDDLQSLIEHWIARLPEEDARSLWVRTRPPVEPVPGVEATV